MAIKDEEDAEVKASEFKDEVDDEKALKYADNYEGSEGGPRSEDREDDKVTRNLVSNVTFLPAAKSHRSMDHKITVGGGGGVVL